MTAAFAAMFTVDTLVIVVGLPAAFALLIAIVHAALGVDRVDRVDRFDSIDDIEAREPTVERHDSGDITGELRPRAVR